MAGNHRSGRKPKPAALRALEGGRSSRPAPKTLGGLPEPTDMVKSNPLALTYWNSYADTLSALGVLAVEHRELLSTLACVSADYEEARKDMAWTRDLQFLKRIDALAALKVKMLGEFGLTPTMAGKVARPDNKPASKWTGLLDGTGGRR